MLSSELGETRPVCLSQMEGDSPTDDSSPVETSEEIVTSFLPLLESLNPIIESVSLRLRLEPCDAEDFASTVMVHVIEDDYRVLRRFRGDSSWKTFLTRVVRNLGTDFLHQRLGRWQPSRRALALGPVAVRLETLQVRDGLGRQESTQILVTEGTYTEGELLEIDQQLPIRTRRRMEGESHLQTLSSRERVECRLENRDRRRTLLRLRAALDEALHTLNVEEVEVLRLFYEEGLPLVDIARICSLRQRKAYTIHDRCRRRLRRCLEKVGLKSDEVIDALGWPEARLRIDYERRSAEVKSHRLSSPSTAVESA